MNNIIDFNKAREEKAAEEFGKRQILDADAVNRALHAGRYYLTIEDDAVAIKVYFGHTDAKTAVLVKTANAYVEFFENEMKRFGLKEDDMLIQASSSLDFPHEYTKDADTIKLCKLINES